MTLEPTARIVFLIIAAHGAVLGSIWWWMQNSPGGAPRDQQQGLHWFSPQDMATPVAQPVSPEFAARLQPAPAPPVEAPKSAPAVAPKVSVLDVMPMINVTVTPRPAITPPAGSPQSAEMAIFDEAIAFAFERNWVPPSNLGTARKPIDLHVAVVIARDGSVMTYLLENPSGNSQANISVLHACRLVKRVPLPLPPEFSGDSYEVKIHFHAE